MEGLAAIQNVTQERQRLQHDGINVYYFEPGEIKLLNGNLAAFAESRVTVSHRKVDGKATQIVEGKKPFRVIPLEDALAQGAKLPEHPSLVEARHREAEKKADKKKLMAEIMDELQDQGWTPPEAAFEKSKKGGK